MRINRQIFGIGVGVASAVFRVNVCHTNCRSRRPGPGSGGAKDATGIVTQAPPDFRFGEWKIGEDVDHAVTGTTTFTQEFGPFDLNKCVHVRYTDEVSNTTHLALRIDSSPRSGLRL